MLRKAFGDDAHVPRYIETFSKRGYRLIAPVTEVAPSQMPTRASPGRRPVFTLGLGAAFLVVSVRQAFGHMVRADDSRRAGARIDQHLLLPALG